MGNKENLWKQIEKLSALSLREEEMEQMEKDMDEIDSFLSVLQDVNLDEKESAGAETPDRLREDTVSSDAREQVYRLPVNGQGREEA